MEIRGKGSVIPLENKPRRKCRHWKLSVPVGRHPSKKGAYCKKSRNFWGTWTEANLALEEFRNELRETQQSAFSENITVKQFCDYWQEQRKLGGGLSERTITNNQMSIDKYCNEFGKLFFKDLTAELVNKAHGAFIKSGNSRATVNTYFRTFKQILKAAYKGGVIKSYIADDVTPVKPDTKEARALSTEEFAAFLEKLNFEKPFHIALLLCACCGLRRSEVLALRWKDYREGALFVSGSLSESGERTRTKTIASNDAVPIIPSVCVILDAQKKRHAKEIADAAANLDIEDAYIVHRGLSGNYRPKYFSAWWMRKRKSFGLEGFKIHELRHSFASELNRQGASLKDIQSLVRHASIKTTADIYTHVDIAEKRAAVVPLEVQFAPNLRLNADSENKNTA